MMKPETELEFPARLRIAVEEAGGPRAVSRKSGINERSLQAYLAGDHLPKLDALVKLTEATGCDLHWLMTGKQQRQPEVWVKAGAVNTELMARIVDGFMKLYKELKITAVPAELGRRYAEVHDDIVAATADQTEQFAMVKMAVAQHRRELLAPPTAETTGKQRA